jgi:hypothetical protein
LQRLISLRLTEEAARNGVTPEALGEAFTRAMEELTGAERRHQREASAESDG